MSLNASELFRRNVKTVLDERGMTITQLAELTESSRPGLSRVLSGDDGITIERADKIAKALDFTLSELLEEKLRIPVKSS